MHTTKLVLGLAAVASLAGTLPAQSANSSNYDVWIAEMKFTHSDMSMPASADLSRTNPLQPAFYATQLDDGRWVGTKARAISVADEIRNPLHPQYRR